MRKFAFLLGSTGSLRCGRSEQQRCGLSSEEDRAATTANSAVVAARQSYAECTQPPGLTAHHRRGKKRERKRSRGRDSNPGRPPTGQRHRTEQIGGVVNRPDDPNTSEIRRVTGVAWRSPTAPRGGMPCGGRKPGRNHGSPHGVIATLSLSLLHSLPTPPLRATPEGLPPR